MCDVQAYGQSVLPIKSVPSPAASPPNLVWPVDHGGAIGWPSGYGGLAVLTALFKPPAKHLARYQSLLGLMP
jgi:hypothetical protein